MTHLRNWFGALTRTRADDLRDTPPSTKTHAHFHEHGRYGAHVHRHRHDQWGYEHAHSHLAQPPEDHG